MFNDYEEGTSRFPEQLGEESDKIQLREIPPTPIKTTFDVEREPRTRANSAVSDISFVSAVSVTESEYLKTIASPPRSVSKTRGRSHSNESRYSIFPSEVPRRKSTASTKTTRTSKARATSVAASEWSTTLDVPVRSETRASKAPRASGTSRSRSSSRSPSRSPSRSRGYSNTDSDRTISVEVPARAGSISLRPRGISNSDSMVSARTSICQDWGDHRNLLTTQHPPRTVPRNDLMAQFEDFVDEIDEVPTKRSTLKRIIAPSKKKARWMPFNNFIRNHMDNKSNTFDEKAKNSDGAEVRRWKSRCSIAAAFAGSVLVIYIVFTIWASQRSGDSTYIGTIYEGDCSTVNATNLGLHILINVITMAISIASACALYFLSSPTRKEIDEAHARGRSFDIGVLSLRNLRSLKKKVMFGLLILSSLPIHFLGNSMVFSSHSEVDYDVIIASSQFLDQTSVDCSQDVAATCGETDHHPRLCETHLLNATDLQDTSNLCNTSTSLHQNANQKKFQRLNTTECLTAYSTLSNPSLNYGNVLVITQNQPLFTNNTILLAFHHMTYSSVLSGHGWTCGPDDPLPGQGTCDIPNLILNADIWTLGPSMLPTTSNSTSLASYERWRIDHCLVETLPFQPMCQLQYSRLVMICIIIASAVKFICILFIAITMTKPVLSTVKDAVTSFQGRPDAVTSNRNFVHRNSAWKSKDGLLILELEAEGRPRNLRWYHGANLPLWLSTLFLCTVLLAIPLILLTTATVPIPSPYSIRLGNYSPLAIIKIFSWSSKAFVPLPVITNTQLFPTVLLTNLPQFAISILLFLFAQALFVHHVEVVGSDGSKRPFEYMDLGYNPLGILTSLVFGGGMLGILMASGLWRLSGGQLVGSESMDIAAACKNSS
ncbi:hypothetical protein SBOR_4709 [Sclerotinia borealis F-4128]|uniref:DUF6536 domain-containing protein n=1 Tax=Sclerotinia borealis (strain F-4128) TaxID=1432307 RepID=W9CDU2_SCLBF|nr:hypothetical protein SBOR_4709 [Sclerotinia borealis F-4128]